MNKYNLFKILLLIAGTIYSQACMSQNDEDNSLDFSFIEYYQKLDEQHYKNSKEMEKLTAEFLKSWNKLSLKDQEVLINLERIERWHYLTKGRLISPEKASKIVKILNINKLYEYLIRHVLTNTLLSYKLGIKDPIWNRPNSFGIFVISEYSKMIQERNILLNPTPSNIAILCRKSEASYQDFYIVAQILIDYHKNMCKMYDSVASICSDSYGGVHYYTIPKKGDFTDEDFCISDELLIKQVHSYFDKVEKLLYEKY